MEPLTVSQATTEIKKLLESNFRQLSIQGEISNLKLHSSGHAYFSLKDAQAQIAAVLFSRDAIGLKRPLQSGDKVIVKGELTVYEPHGAYKLIVKELNYVGVGELLLQLEQLKKKLLALGWFEKSLKKPLPKFPKRIGVITSPTGAVIQDIIHVLSRRVGTFHLILNPVRVQGEGAAAEIAQAIEEMNRYDVADVLIVGRGGGSLEDLWAFNEEIVLKAIHESHLPIISAVGHETDYCLSDFVADVRAPTPSAAAEIVMAETAQQRAFIEQAKKRLSHGLMLLARSAKERLKGIMRATEFHNPRSLVQQRALKLDDKAQRLHEWMELKIAKDRQRLEHLKMQLALVNPLHILERGYALVFDEKTSSLVRSAKQVTAKHKLMIQFYDGKILTEGQI